MLPQVEQELNPSRIEYAVLAEFAGLIVGATTWGVMADIIGRKVSFNVSRISGARDVPTVPDIWVPGHALPRRRFWACRWRRTELCCIFVLDSLHGFWSWWKVSETFHQVCCDDANLPL